PVPTTALRLRGSAADALVTIDDRYVGKLGEVGRRGVALPRGEHRISVEKVGCFPWDRLVNVGEAPVELEVELTPVPE
ncbi:MAG: hypothetical protein HY744_34800, partial [Deltaproteobacteria bacterium]|nr:hypothetical protein [Deltaproteobacteria bacterium]